MTVRRMIGEEVNYVGEKQLGQFIQTNENV